MSDIKIEFTWWELLLVSPILGWPGAIVGAALGGLLWRKRPIVGTIVGAVVGNLAVFLVRVLMM